MLLLQASTTALYGAHDLLLIAPELILTVAGCVALVLEVILPRRHARWTAYFTLASLGLALVSLITQWKVNSALLPLTGFYGMIRLDFFALVFRLIFLAGAALTVAVAVRYLEVGKEQRGEFYALLLWATVGMMFLASAYDLIALYISLELMAVAFYVLVAFAKREPRSNEAALKYFLLGAFSSGVLLYGMSLLFGLAGSTNLGDISQAVAVALGASPAVEVNGVAATNFFKPLLLTGTVALAAGLFFKISAVPFHMWAPDAYEGAPTPVTAFLSTGSKAASFALFARLFADALEPLRSDWAPLLGLVAALTIFVGNWAAVTQTNAKRLLAYSSIANAGYLLLALIAGNRYGNIGLTFYLFVYTVMNIGAFGVLMTRRDAQRQGDAVDDLSGLGQQQPLTALMMTIFLLSLGGLPATGGFIGKYFLFGGLLQRGAAEGKSWYYALAIWAVLNTVISFYYYLRFVKTMYLGETTHTHTAPRPSPLLQTALLLAALTIILTGVYPQPFIAVVESINAL